MNSSRTPSNRARWPFIVFPVVVLLLIVSWVAGFRAYYVFVVEPRKVSAEPTREADVPSQEENVGTRTPTSEPSTPPKPGAPVPCDPEYPNVLQCFPKDYNPDAAMDGVAKEGWTCLREGDPDEIGGTVSEIRICEAANNVDQPYTIRASIKYDTHNYKPSGNLRSFRLHVTVSASSGKGEHTSKQDATDTLIKVFKITAKHIWRDHPEHLKEATDAFNQLKPQCASEAGRTIQGVAVTMPSGYEISCSATTPIAVGDVITYDQSLTIQPA